jgi:hypothetical protein
MSARVIWAGSWFLAVASALADSSGQLPSGSGSSVPSQPTCVEPLGPLWPSCMPIFALDWVCTKSTMRLKAADCASL